MTAEAAKPVESGDDDFLLVDNQVRLSSVTTQYSRYLERLISQAAVDQSAQISIDIDPERERVLLHSVRVFRDGRAVDKLADARISLLNREENLDRRQINGRVTLHIVLQDVRVGDVLDYSYSQERTDPIAERKYQHAFMTQWSSPVRQFRLRVLRSADRKLNVKDLSKLGPPRQTRHGDWLEMLWEGHDVPALPEESSRPQWHFRYPRVEFSEFDNWGEVRAWTLPWYLVPPGKDAAFDALVADLKAETDEAARIVRALRFVQDDIRYTGLEIGAGAWRPTAPAVVLARRYGDCKDKVLLLVSLLRAVGVEAYAALVSSQSGRGVADRLPSPWAFDHVIAKVRRKDRDYWLDATASGQGGTLDSLAQADFGLALVLAPDGNALEAMPVRDGRTPSTQVVETYDFREGISNTASLWVHTTYREESADFMRVRMRTTTTAKLGNDYLDYYRRNHRGTHLIEPLRLSDDREHNVLELDEHYAIDAPFEKKPEGQQFLIEATLITEQTGKPEQVVRTSPLARRFPLHVRHEIIAYLPHGWKIEPDNRRIADPAFEYTSSISYSGNRLVFDHELRNIRDHVPLDGLDEFLAKLDQAHDAAFLTLTDGTVSGVTGPSFALIVTFILGFGLGVLGAVALARLPWRRLPEAEPYAPEGLSGWMVLPVIGVVSSPPFLIYHVWTWFHDLGAAATFQRLAEHVQLLMLIEFLILSAMLVLSVFTAWLMFLRYRAFPYAFIALQVLNIAMLSLDTAVLAAIGSAGAKGFARQSGTLVFRVLFGAGWAAYMLMAQRVRATFVNPWGGVDRTNMRVVGFRYPATGKASDTA